MSPDRPTPPPAPPRPIPGSYWLIPGRVLVGEFPGTRSRADTMNRLQQLLATGVTRFIDLTEPGERPSYEAMLPATGPHGRGVAYLREPIPDHGIPASPEVMQRILSRVRTSLNANQVVYLHCRAGIGRSALVAGCFLVDGGMSADEAIDTLQVCWQQSSRSLDWDRIPETEEQLRYLRDWRGRATTSDAPTPAPIPVDVAPLDYRSRLQGALLGLAAGDLIGGGRDGRDVTALSAHAAFAVCAAESLLSCGRFDAKDQMERLLRWRQESSRGGATPPGVSAEVARAFATYRWRGIATAGSHDTADRDAASLTRAIPAAMFATDDAAAATALAAECSRTTHQGPVVLDVCRYVAGMAVGALHGAGVAIANVAYEPVPGLWRQRPLKQEVADAAGAVPLAAVPPRRVRSGDVLKTLVNLRRVLALSADFETTIVEAVRTARDPALDGALSGALAGAIRGRSAIPPDLLRRIPDAERIESLADGFERLNPQTAMASSGTR